jgi:hypothetical protein
MSGQTVTSSSKNSRAAASEPPVSRRCQYALFCPAGFVVCVGGNAGLLFAHSNFQLHNVHTLRFLDLSSDRIHPPHAQTLLDLPVKSSRSAIEPSTVHGTLTNAFQLRGVDTQDEIGTWEKHFVGEKHKVRYELLTAIRANHCPTRRPYPHSR